MRLSKSFNNISNKKRLLFINYYFPPMGGGGVQRIVKFLKYIDLAKFDVTVLTVRPSFFYSEDNSLASEIPTSVSVVRSGSLDPFRLLFLIKKWFGNNNQAEPRPARESGGGLRKFAMALFLPDSRALWLPFALWHVRKIQRHRPVDAVIASAPPFTTSLIGILAKRFVKCPIVLDFRDAWTQNPYLPEISRFHTSMNEKLEKYCFERADGLIFVNPALHRYYQKKYAFSPTLPNVTIRNGFDPTDFPPPASTQFKGKFVLGIMGTIYSQGNRPLGLLKAIAELAKERPGLEKHFQLTFLGKWTETFLAHVEALGISNFVRFIPYRPHKEALTIAAGFDALSLAIESAFPGSSEVTPGRIYEYLGLKKPILATCPPDSDLAYLIRHCKAGEAIDDGDIESIKAVLQKWISQKGELQNRYAFKNLDHFSRPYLTGQLQDFLATL